MSEALENIDKGNRPRCSIDAASQRIGHHGMPGCALPRAKLLGMSPSPLEANSRRGKECRQEDNLNAASVAQQANTDA